MAARGVSVLKFVGTVSLGVLTVCCAADPIPALHDAVIQPAPSCNTFIYTPQY